MKILTKINIFYVMTVLFKLLINLYFINGFKIYRKIKINPKDQLKKC